MAARRFKANSMLHARASQKDPQIHWPLDHQALALATVNPNKRLQSAFKYLTDLTERLHSFWTVVRFKVYEDTSHLL